jgi:hypothetical protein
LGDREGVAQRRQQRLSDVIEDSGHRGVNIDVMFSPVTDGFPLKALRCLKTKRGRIYTRPITGTAKSPQRNAFNTPPGRGRASSDVLWFEISGFVMDSSRSYAK